MMRALENFCRTIRSEQFLNARIEIAAVGMGDDLRMPEKFIALEHSHLSELNIRPKGDTPIGAALNPAMDQLSDRRPSARRKQVLLLRQLSGSLKAALIQTFREGHGNPEKRVSPAQLRNDLEKLLFLMEKEPQRRTLPPENPRPRGDKTSGRASAQGKEKKFCMNF